MAAIKEIAGFSIGIFVKVDTGYHRAGLTTATGELRALVARILSSVEPAGNGCLQGFYCHAGHSYSGDSEVHAMSLLMEEVRCLERAAHICEDISSKTGDQHTRRLILSVGATPTATSIQNISSSRTKSLGPHKEASELQACIERINNHYELEIHAGVYPILDLQQLATHASPSALSGPLSTADLGLTILVEVASLYPGRDSSEALVAAGSLALGREPCKSYSGWGIVSPWRTSLGTDESSSGWMIGRISQEHGMLTQSPDSEAQAELQVGQKLRIWPNHAWYVFRSPSFLMYQATRVCLSYREPWLHRHCFTAQSTSWKSCADSEIFNSVVGAGFGWYLVVDSSLPEDQRDKIVDVWVRWRGW